MSKLQAVRAPRALLVPTERPGFFTGVRCFFSGFGMIVSTPRAWPFAAVPVVAALALFFLFSFLSITFIPDLVQRGFDGDGFWVGVVQVLASVAAVVVGAFLALALAQPASGPALEALVRVIEREIGADKHAPTPFFTDVARSTVSALIASSAAPSPSRCSSCSASSRGLRS